MRNPFPLVVGFVACFIAGYAGLLLSPAQGTVAWIVLVGIGPAAFPLALALINLRTRTSDGAVALSGFVQGVGYTISGIGPVTVGALYAATGAWTAPIVFLVGTLAVLLAAAAVACRPVMLEDTWGRRAAVAG